MTTLLKNSDQIPENFHGNLTMYSKEQGCQVDFSHNSPSDTKSAVLTNAWQASSSNIGRLLLKFRDKQGKNSETKIQCVSSRHGHCSTKVSVFNPSISYN